ncbi:MULTISPECIES: hypothetical protein [Paenibacillus]|uniref:hypothetical protein n=1 Tax=Paenibacillus TaxID=44249 RepID=UPI000FDB5C88|nr:hypothetical protein [Paenibacillus amylolyticus]
MATWTPIENAKIVGILPDYRLYKQNNSDSSAAKICAQNLVNNDVFGILTARINNNVSEPHDAIIQHIKHMDKIASGEIPPNQGDEYAWASCLKL